MAGVPHVVVPRTPDAVPGDDVVELRAVELVAADPDARPEVRRDRCVAQVAMAEVARSMTPATRPRQPAWTTPTDRCRQEDQWRTVRGADGQDAARRRGDRGVGVDPGVLARAGSP